jgi:hypothetical protein
MERLNKKLLSLSLAKESAKVVSLAYNGEKFVCSGDKNDTEKMQYSQFFEYLRRYMNINVEMFEKHGILINNSNNQLIKNISFDADIYHYHNDYLIFVIRNGINTNELDVTITNGRSSNITSTITYFDGEGIAIKDKFFLESFMFTQNTNKLTMDIMTQDISNEPVIVMTIKPYFSDKPEII